MQIHFHGVTLGIVQGDIAKQNDCEAVVNASHVGYKPDGGVSTAIHQGAGPVLYEHCKLLAPLKPSIVVMTPGFNLPNKCILHCLGPRHGTTGADMVLAQCFINALDAVDKNSINSIAFPAISTGAMGYPIRDAALISLTAIIDHAHKLKNVKIVRVVLWEENHFDIFQNILIKLMWSKRISSETISM